MPIKFPRKTKEALVPVIQTYFAEERDETLGNLETEFLLDFFISQIGPYIYNQAISDTQAHLRDKLTNIEEGLYELEQPLPRQ
jgi:uncharacterized protein (DUF2164 family)